MSKVTSKLQVTIPKAVADRYGIHPGDELEWTPAGEGALRVVVGRDGLGDLDAAQRLRLFDEATARQRKRERAAPRKTGGARGWTREELYDRGRSR